MRENGQLRRGPSKAAAVWNWRGRIRRARGFSWLALVDVATCATKSKSQHAKLENHREFHALSLISCTIHKKNSTTNPSRSIREQKRIRSVLQSRNETKLSYLLVATGVYVYRRDARLPFFSHLKKELKRKTTLKSKREKSHRCTVSLGK